MRGALRTVLVLVVLLAGGLAVPPARAQAPQSAPPIPIPGPCVEGVLPSGALSLTCVPLRGWNDDLVVWAHGYVAFNEPLDFYNLELPDGTYLPDLVQLLGFAFTTTSYRDNGLVVLEGADDIRELVAAFPAYAGQEPELTYLTGASEGGWISTLLTEQSPDLFDGTLATCGPIGDARAQINYIGDFRLLFDYFFPGIIPGSPLEIPMEVIDNWETIYVPRIESALAANPVAAVELIRTSKAAIDRNDTTTVEATTINLLWYNVFGTNDATEKLGGNPFGNQQRWYSGSRNDLRLNHSVERVSADPAALLELERYQTSGDLTIPLVTLHTTGDEIIPFWHQRLYTAKANPTGDGRLTPIPASRYGHCNFTTAEVLGAFATLVSQVSGSPPEGLTYLTQMGHAQ